MNFTMSISPYNYMPRNRTWTCLIARKFLDSEEVSFRKAKLLTKAYYQLLRTTNNADIEASKEIQYGYLIIELFTTFSPNSEIWTNQKN